MENLTERKIPVFSVWKKGAILKNIFLINTAPHSLDEIEVQEGKNCKTQKEFEETLVIGRHPDCDIRLEHPSVSRFHLRVHSIPFSTHLSITDLSSVHGTWVSGKKIEPNLRTRLNESDTLRIGESSRIYKLHWIPFSQAYDTERPFIPPLEFPEPQEDEEEEEENMKTDNRPESENETDHLGISEKLATEETSLQKQTTDAVKNEDMELLESSFGDENSNIEIRLADKIQNENSEDSVDQISGSISLFLAKSVENGSFEVLEDENSNICMNTNSGSESEVLENDQDDGSWNFWCGSHTVVPSSSPAKDVLPETENHNNLNREECKDRKLWSFWSENMGDESLCSYFSDAEAFCNVYQSPEPMNSGKKQLGSSVCNSGCSIWSRRGKQESVPQILTSSKTKGKKMKTNQENVIVNDENSISRVLFLHEHEEDEIFTPDKENFTPNTHRLMRKLSLLKMNTTVSPDISPATVKEQKTVSKDRSSVLKEKTKGGKRVPFQTLISESPQKSVNETCMSDTTVRSGKSVNFPKSTNKRKVLQERKTVPLLKERKTIVSESSQKSSVSDTAVRSRKSVNCPKPRTKNLLQEKCTGEKTRKWNMIVDTTTLLNKRSRQALQLLAGLKGTQLIIPRIVMTELDSLKQQTSFFFRRNLEVQSALDWIHDCISENQGRAHVQYSVEEGRPVAPTPPGSPLSDVGSREEVLSPTPDDHVLDYALCFRKSRNDGQKLVILSNDVTLKIKAMAEGILCEGAEEFRESLVNPFSERFMWANSSPRGRTWCFSDDIVVKEKFYRNPFKMMMTPKSMMENNVKGLKLILLH